MSLKCCASVVQERKSGIFNAHSDNDFRDSHILEIYSEFYHINANYQLDLTLKKSRIKQDHFKVPGLK